MSKLINPKVLVMVYAMPNSVEGKIVNSKDYVDTIINRYTLGGVYDKIKLMPISSYKAMGNFEKIKKDAKNTLQIFLDNYIDFTERKIDFLFVNLPTIHAAFFQGFMEAVLDREKSKLPFARTFRVQLETDQGPKFYKKSYNQNFGLNNKILKTNKFVLILVLLLFGSRIGYLVNKPLDPQNLQANKVQAFNIKPNETTYMSFLNQKYLKEFISFFKWDDWEWFITTMVLFISIIVWYNEQKESVEDKLSQKASFIVFFHNRIVAIIVSMPLDHVSDIRNNSYSYLRILNKGVTLDFNINRYKVGPVIHKTKKNLLYREYFTFFSLQNLTTLNEKGEIAQKLIAGSTLFKNLADEGIKSVYYDVDNIKGMIKHEPDMLSDRTEKSLKPELRNKNTRKEQIEKLLPFLLLRNRWIRKYRSK